MIRRSFSLAHRNARAASVYRSVRLTSASLSVCLRMLHAGRFASHRSFLWFRDPGTNGRGGSKRGGQGRGGQSGGGGMASPECLDATILSEEAEEN